MWVVCLISLVTTCVAVSVFSMMCMQQYRFSKNAILVQGRVVAIQHIEKHTWPKHVFEAPVIDYSFQGQGWRYCAALDVSKQHIYVGKRLNLRVLHDRPALVCSDLELVHRDGWSIFFALSAVLSFMLTIYLSTQMSDVFSLTMGSIIVISMTVFASMIVAQRWYSSHPLSTKLTQAQAQPLGLIVASKVSSQS